MKLLKTLLLALTLVAGPAFADTATVNISPSATRDDGVTAFDPTGAIYTFYRAADPAGPYDTVVGAIAEPLREITVPVEPAAYYVVFTTTDADGRVGPASAYATIPAEIAPPGAGTIDSVTITITLP